MDLIPINKLKISKEKWINQTVKYENEIYNKDIINDMSLDLYEWMMNLKDFNVTIDYNSFKENFTNLLYNSYLDE